MTFNVLTLVALVFVPMIAAFAVQLLTHKLVGKALSIVLAIAAMAATAWAILTFGLGVEFAAA
ncbi:MAG: hypothetical protein QNJ13_14365 [Paracoccaceae bacterium]|nr:hypothetical protein [Paracoccaceae bacterium]